MIADLSALPVALQAGLAGLLGLLVGSFLNVVIFRYPKMLQYQWSAQSFEWINQQPYPEAEPPGLVSPGSHCGNCKAPVKAWQNIPLLSYAILRGRCANCKTAISIRYPLVELLTGILSASVIYYFGYSQQGAAALLLSWVLVTLTFIDLDHQILPDDIVLPILWLGLALSLMPVFATTADAVIGAIAGYMFLWTVYHLFKKITGKEGMGHGDFKLMALFGAWLGWQYIPQIILISTLAGSFVGVSLIILKRISGDRKIPFGPYIAVAGWIAMLWGQQINQAYLRYSGL